ncbi:MAG: metal ABC transporter ATP-binding protein [Phycisphaerae bacterium]|nr:metal ABC transporter ATP-binding protein [Phycisphaerae bacterium]
MSQESIWPVTLENVWFSYDGTPVLEDVNLSIGRCEYVSMVGPNGGGKTTLLKIIAGLLRPDRGRVRVYGEPPQHVQWKIGYVPQHQHYDVHFPVRVLEVVLMGRLRRSTWIGRYSRADRESALRALEEVELADLRSRPFSALSGGQRQRVLIARALAADPQILLLDEPMANVDVVVERELNELLQDLSGHMTVVLVTHDLGFVSHYVKNVICVNRRVSVHPTSDFTGELVDRVYGGHYHAVRHDHVDEEPQP